MSNGFTEAGLLAQGITAGGDWLLGRQCGAGILIYH